MDTSICLYGGRIITILSFASRHDMSIGHMYLYLYPYYPYPFVYMHTSICG